MLNPSTIAELAELPVLAVRRLRADGAIVVDARPVRDYARAHIPGALSIPLRAQFATWLGWLVPLDTAVVAVVNPDQDVTDLVWQAVNIGVERLVGVLAGGVEAWTAAGQPTAATRLLRPAELAAAGASWRVLDVRQDAEFAGGHLPGATHVELGALPHAADEVPNTPTVVMCGHGERAAGAASLLERTGHRDVAVLAGGPGDWAEATGGELETELETMS